MVKNLPAMERHRFDLWVRKIPWKRGHGNPLPYYYLKNPMDREAWQASVHGIAGVEQD